MNTTKQAKKDAVEYARAQMFFGEGAGIRRRIIDAKVSDLAMNDENYAKAFDKALGEQSWSDHATQAVKERKRIDRGKSVQKNTKALLTGNRAGASSTAVVVLIMAGYAAHETGYDRVLLEKGKQQYRKGKAWVDAKRAENKPRPNISSVS